MGIVNELQNSAVNEDVMTVLRKARLVASKLGRTDIAIWLNNEQIGYANKDDVPDYRIVKADFCANTNGYIPAGGGMMKSGIVPLSGFPIMDYPVTESIATIMSWIDSIRTKKSGNLYMTVSQDMANTVKGHLNSTVPGVLRQIVIMTQLDEFKIQGIPEQIKDRVLEWACKLEAAGVHGEGHSFTKDEKDAATHINLTLNDQSTKVTAHTIQGAVQASSPNSIQTTTVSANSQATEALNKLREIIENASELDDVDKGEAKSTVDRIHELATQPTTPKTKLKLNEKVAILTGVLSVGKDVWKLAEPHIHILTDIFK